MTEQELDEDFDDELTEEEIELFKAAEKYECPLCGENICDINCDAYEDEYL